MPWRRLCFARLCRMNGKFFHDRSIRPRDFACSATFGAAPYSTGKRKPHSQTLRKTAKISRESYDTSRRNSAVQRHCENELTIATETGRPPMSADIAIPDFDEPLLAKAVE